MLSTLQRDLARAAGEGVGSEPRRRPLQKRAFASTHSAGISGRRTGSFAFTPASTDETLSCTAIGGAPETPFALLGSVSARRETTISQRALGFAGRGYAGFRSNGRKPTSIDEAKT